MNYYDLVLASIPVLLIGVAGLLLVAGANVTTAVPLAALTSIGVIGHALFIRSPVDTEHRSEHPPLGGHNKPPRFESAD